MGRHFPVFFLVGALACSATELVGAPDGSGDAASEADAPTLDAPDAPDAAEASDVVLEPAPAIDTWILHVDSEGSSSRATACTVTGDGGLALAGSWEREVGDSGPSVWIAKLDADGALGWSLSAARADTVEGLAEGSDGSLVAAGVTHGFLGGSADAFLLRLDSYGTPIRQRALSHMENDVALDIGAMPDGGYAVVGMASGIDEYEGSLWILALDSELGIEWEKRLDLAPVDYEGGSLAVSSSGDLIVAARSRFLDTVWLGRLGPLGGMIWQKLVTGSIPGSIIDYVGIGVSEMTNGDIVLAVSGGTGVTLLRFEASGALLGQLRLVGTSGQAMTRGSAGRVLVAGNAYYPETHNVFMLGIDVDGTVAWRKDVQDVSGWVPFWMGRTRDGGAVAVVGNAMRTWVVKLAEDGDFHGACDMLAEVPTSVYMSSFVVEEALRPSEDASMMSTSYDLIILEAPAEVVRDCPPDG